MSYQGIDLIGIESVCAYIRQTGFNFFYIHRYNSQSGALPLYESKGARNVNEAADQFKTWAALCNPDENSNYYQITVCQVEEGAEETARKQRNKKYKMSFVLRMQKEQAVINQPSNNPGNGYMARADVEAMIADKYELAFLKMKVQKLQEENAELSEDLDEAEKELEKSSSNDWMTNLIPVLPTLLAGKENNQPQKQGAALSGITVNQKERINAAIKTLLQYDDDLDTHLAKLAKLAKEDTPKFKVLIGMLDSNL